MKKLFVIVCLLLPMMSLQAKAIQEDYKNADEKARISYAFGMLVASNLKSIDLELDYKALSDGIKAMIENLELEFTEQEAMEIVEAALQKSMDKTSEENERREIEFLANNKQRPEIKVTPSGLQYEIITETDGEKPDGKSIVRVYYTGTFTDGTPFDSSNEDEGAYIPLEMVISGWTEGLMLMSVGSKYRFYIPSELAYGKEGIQSIIPPYSTLIFTVELLEITEGEDSEE
ncbi:MAG: FKBP-type peptidyl-prolyl cis-trans isomerase [Treponema sp.]|nr:FKBP-type peptidyl-prolyl cis-trans isomerase [Treponema sp.]